MVWNHFLKYVYFLRALKAKFSITVMVLLPFQNFILDKMYSYVMVSFCLAHSDNTNTTVEICTLYCDSCN